MSSTAGRLLGRTLEIVGPILAVMGWAINTPHLLGRLRHYPVLNHFPDNPYLFMASTVLIGAALLGILYIREAGPADEGRRRGLYGLVLLSLIPAGLCISQLWSYPASEELRKDLGSPHWVGYDPRDFDPTVRPNPSRESMAQELGWIRRAGFTGVITFSSRGSLADIPELAHEANLKVIMGVWNPNDPSELAAAVANKDYVIGYSVGHDHLDAYGSPDGVAYSLPELTDAVQYLRNATSRPVTTTEFARAYDEPSEPRLAPASDWLFPDVSFPMRDTCEDTPTTVSNVIKDLEKAALLAHRLQRPLMLKMLTFPHAGTRCSSRELQEAFLHQLICQINNGVLGEIPAFMVHSAFDTAWKTNTTNPWDAFTGVITDDGTPLIEINEVSKNCRQ